MKLRGLHYVLRCRPRERGALGGIVTESAALFSSGGYRRGFRALVPSRWATCLPGALRGGPSSGIGLGLLARLSCLLNGWPPGPVVVRYLLLSIIKEPKINSHCACVVEKRRTGVAICLLFFCLFVDCLSFVCHLFGRPAAREHELAQGPRSLWPAKPSIAPPASYAPSS